MAYIRGTLDLQDVYNKTGVIDKLKSNNLNTSSRYTLLNSEYSTNSSQTTGITNVYSPTSTKNSATGSFTSSTVTTDNSFPFSQYDIILITGANFEDNNGLFEVQSYSAGTITINTSPLEDFSKNAFTPDPTISPNCFVTKVNISVVRTGQDGKWELSSGNNTTVSGLAYTDILSSNFELNLGGDFTTIGGDITITVTGPTDITFPESGTLLSSETGQLLWKDPVKVATTDALNDNASISGSITYNSTGGTSLRGQITGTLSVSDTFTIDGVTLSSADNGERILLKNEEDTVTSPDGARNGIWTVTISGTNLTLDRAVDFDEDAEVTRNVSVFASEGAQNSDFGFTLTNDGSSIIVGGVSGSPLSFKQVAGEVSGGDGISVNSGSISTDLKTNGGLVIESEQLAVDLGASNITGTLSVSDGGTGATTLASNEILIGNGTSAVTTSTLLNLVNSLSVITINSDYTVLSTDYAIFVNTSTATGNVTITLPAASSGRHIKIADSGGNAITNKIIIDGNGTEEINGALTYTINGNYNSAALLSDGSNWFII